MCVGWRYLLLTSKYRLDTYVRIRYLLASYDTYSIFSYTIPLYLLECDTYSNVIGRENFFPSEKRVFKQIQTKNLKEKKDKNGKKEKIIEKQRKNSK